MAITQVITTLPTAPDPATDTRDEFSTKAAAYVLAQKAMVPELNTWAGQVNAIAATAVGDVATAIGAAAADTPVGADKLAWRKDATGVLKSVTFADALAWFTAPVAQDFRLSLTTTIPVTTVDVTGATTIYAVPKVGNRIGLYDGAIWRNYTSAEFSLALGTLSSGKPYDVFCYQNADVPTLEFLAWTNDTTRATALAYNAGILIKSGDATRRYLGTFYTTSTTQTEDSAANRYLWNYYHRVGRSCVVIDATANWTYSTSTYRQANNSAANQLNVLVGVIEDNIEVNVVGAVTNSTATLRYAQVGIGINSTTVNSAHIQLRVFVGNTQSKVVTSTLVGATLLGKNSYVRLEIAEGTDTQTWIGSSGTPLIQTAIYGRVMA